MHSRLDVAFAKFMRVKFYLFVSQALGSISSAFFGAKKFLAYILQLKRAKAVTPQIFAVIDFNKERRHEETFVHRCIRSVLG